MNDASVQLKDWIIDQARMALPEQRVDGSMPAGHNGPYSCPERPLRNTCHWLITWCHVAKWTNEQVFMDAAQRALEYILLPMHRPSRANWWQRTLAGRDKCNGVIGAAWVIEALECAWGFLGSSEALREASEVFALHRFDEDLGLWFRTEIDGSVLSIDRNFNHQLWFAASGGRLAHAGDELARKRVGAFLEHAGRLFSTYPDGLIKHRIGLHWWDRYLEPGRWAHELYVRLNVLRGRSTTILKGHLRDTGYHAFNLHGFALLHRVHCDHQLWASDTFRGALAFARSSEHEARIERDNPYAYPYNPVGFEMAFALSRFVPSSLSEQSEWIARQIRALGVDTSSRYGQCATDPNTARARIYEAVEWLREVPPDLNAMGTLNSHYFGRPSRDTSTG